MAVGSKNFPANNSPDTETAAGGETQYNVRATPSGKRAWAEIFVVFVLIEAILWTPRSLGHALLFVAVAASVLWFTLRSGYSWEQLGFKWPSRVGAWTILAIGGLVAVAIPLGALLTGHPVPASPNWPRFRNIWPYLIWAFLQQFLLQSFFYLRFESVLGSRRTVLANSVLFSLAHLPNLALTAMTLIGAVFFSEMFRRYRSIYATGIVHALLGVTIAYSFADSVMHHMRVGLGFIHFR